VNATKFLTGASTVGSIAIPAVLKHAGVIGWGALAMEFSSFFIFVLAIICYIGMNSEDDYSVLWEYGSPGAFLYLCKKVSVSAPYARIFVSWFVELCLSRFGVMFFFFHGGGEFLYFNRTVLKHFVAERLTLSQQESYPFFFHIMLSRMVLASNFWGEMMMNCLLVSFSISMAKE
jgi:intracellular septation protein A